MIQIFDDFDSEELDLQQMPRRCRCVRLLLALSLFSMLLGSGCADANPAGRVQLFGKVSLDGKPLDSGTIEFTPLTGKLGSGGKITAGTYNLPREKGLPPGEYLVRITSPVVAAQLAKPAPQAPGMEVDVHLGAERVHARFNSKSQLKLVMPQNTDPYEQDFQVQSR